MRPRSALIAAALAMLVAGCTTAEIAPVRYAPSATPYRLDSGDRLRLVVFGQQELNSVYTVDPSGNFAVPLIGTVSARGLTTQALEQEIAGKLRQGFLKDPSVSVQVETFRPIFILGEVTQAGQYPYSSGLTGEKAVAVAGGFSPRARQYTLLVTRREEGRTIEIEQPVQAPIFPGDTVRVLERWF